MKTGDVFFAKRVRKHPNKPTTEIVLKGYAFGVMLGHLPAHKPPPEEIDCLRLMGSCGYVTFDDVNEILGQEQMDFLLKGCEAKYNPPPPPPEVSPIIDPSTGAPVETAVQQ